MTRRGTLDIFFLALFFLAVTALTVAGFVLREWRPAVASEHGRGVDGMISYLIIVTGIVFVVGHAALIGFLWKFRAAAAAVWRPVGPRAEWLWALIPVITMAIMAEGGVLLIGMPVWSKIYGTPPADAVRVEVVAKQFEWLVRYPGKDGVFGKTTPEKVHDLDNPVGLDESDPAAKDDIVLRGTLHVPVGKTIVVRLRSHDVLHSFSIPEMRVKQDVVPGYTGGTLFVPEKVGTFEIACAELCGMGHYRMRGFLIVHPPEEYAKWLAEQTGWFE